MFAGSTILYKMLVCLSESRGGSSYGESIFSYCGQRYCRLAEEDQIELRIEIFQTFINYIFLHILGNLPHTAITCLIKSKFIKDSFLFSISYAYMCVCSKLLLTRRDARFVKFTLAYNAATIFTGCSY